MPYLVSPEVVWVEGTDEVKLYHAGRGDFQTLNSTAAEIWRRAAAGTPAATIVADLVNRYAAGDPHEGGTVARDVRLFIGTLVELGLLVEAGSGAAGSIDDDAAG